MKYQSHAMPQFVEGPQDKNASEPGAVNRKGEENVSRPLLAAETQEGC